VICIRVSLLVTLPASISFLRVVMQRRSATARAEERGDRGALATPQLGGRHRRTVPVERLLFVDDDECNCDDVRANCVGAEVLHVQGRGGMTAADCEAVLAWAAAVSE
jgi:hypothetical protein